MTPNPDGASKLREELWAMRKRLGHNGIVLDIDELIVFIESSRHDAIAATKEACAQALDGLGVTENEITLRQWCQETIRALPGPDLSAANCGQGGHEYGDGCADCRDAKAALALFAGQVAGHMFVGCRDPFHDGRVLCACNAVLKEDYRTSNTTDQQAWQQHILALVPNPNALAEHDAALVAPLRELLEHDRSQVALHITAIIKAVKSRDWLTEGRGPYEWNDDNWHKEFAAAATEILEAAEPLERIAADWTECSRKNEDVVQARINLKADNAALRLELERERNPAKVQAVLDLLAERDKLKAQIASAEAKAARDGFSAGVMLAQLYECPTFELALKETTLGEKPWAKAEQQAEAKEGA